MELKMSGIIVTVIVLFVAVIALVGIIVWRKKGRKAKDPVLCRDLDEEMADPNEEIIARAKQIGCIARWNIVAHVRAIVANDDFLVAYNQYYDEVHSGKRKLTDKIRLNVKPTFTFWLATEAETPMHTGTGAKCEDYHIINPLIEAAIGVKQNNVNYWAYDKARDILFVKDARIFVPFAGGMPNVEEQVKFYGRTTPEEAKAHFASKVPTI